MSDASTPDQGEVLSFGDPPVASGSEPTGAGASSSAGKRRLWPFALGGLAVLAVGGTGVALGVFAGGGGLQPEDVMPADAVMYADIDFDPGADQKINMMRMLNQFPDVSTVLGDRDDIRALALEELFASADVDAVELQQWVGDRAGIGLVWDGPDNGPTVVVAVEVTDEDAAERTLLSEVEQDELAFDQGYAIVTRSLAENTMMYPVGEGQTAAEIVASAQSASLADDPDFVAAMEPLGRGLASGFVDGGTLSEIMKEQFGGVMGRYDSALMGQELDGTTAFVLKAEPDAFAIDGYFSQSGANTSTPPTQLLAELPDSTMVALAFADGGEAVEEGWRSFMKQIAPATTQVEREISKVEARYNIALPEDIITLLGEDALAAIDGTDLLASSSVGFRSITDPQAAADLAGRLQPLIEEWTGPLGGRAVAADDGLVIASTPEYADVLVDGSGGLLDSQRALDALVDVEAASYVLWVDLDAASTIARLAHEQTADMLQPISALGVTAVSDGEGWSVHARLTFDE